MAKSQDISEQITNRIIAALEQGVTPWVPSWRGQSIMPRRHCGLRYRGINILILWAEAQTRGFRSPFWMTFKQALDYGACVRKGERGTGIVYANRVTRTEAAENGEDVERSFSFLKGYTVFNADQIDGLPERFLPPAPQNQDSMAWDDHAEALAWFEAIPAEVRHGASMPVYIRSQDRIELPERDSRALLTAAAKASDALEYLCTFQPAAQVNAAEDREAA